ncbi:MAG: thioredoxin family protein [Saprospiraceae bacterium]|nr:thioredoxin family protein [Saprospiraceae bacterium]
MRYLTTLFLFSAWITLAAQEASIDFIDNELQEALAMAKEQDKIIFVDAYTTWCGPCKMMDRDVFADASVAAFFNDNFVNLKLDMEKGEGNGFRSTYGVRGFPSFLFLNAAGVVLHRGIGYQPAEQFLQLGKAALDPSKQTGAMTKRYAQGDRDPAFLYDYADALLNSSDPKAIEVGKTYLETQESWTSRKNMEMVVRMMREYEDPYFNYLVEKRHLFIKEFGTDRVDASLSNMIDRHLYTNIEDLDLSTAQHIYSETFPTNKAARLYSLFEVNYHDIKGDQTQYASTARAHIKKYPDQSWNDLNSMAWGFYEGIDSKKDLKAAVKWAKKSIALNANHFNTDTLAALYYKLGKKKPALKWATRAVELAQSVGQDPAETQGLIKKIEAL